jgi:hypothetical protein
LTPVCGVENVVAEVRLPNFKVKNTVITTVVITVFLN